MFDDKKVEHIWSKSAPNPLKSYENDEINTPRD
jgi:hypothetical protein